MKVSFLTKTIPLGFLTSWVLATNGISAEPSAALLKAKQDAEAKGYLFEASHDEIVARAQKEGRVNILTGLDPAAHAPMQQTFKKKYPFIGAVEIYEIDNTDAAQRFVMELKTGRERKWDAAHISIDFYPEYFPFAKKFDLLGMAEQGVLKINPKMVSPMQRMLVALGSTAEVVAYNKKLIPPDKVPNKWEDFLKPELKGRKFIVDIQPVAFTSFPACPKEGGGLEWALKLARGLRNQDPVWVRGHTRVLTAMRAGEYALHFATHFQSITRAMSKDPTGSLQAKILEPVPVQLAEPKIVLNSASHPYAALLFLEHMASPEGQHILDKYGPMKGSIFAPGSALAKAVEGKKLCVLGFEDDFHNGSKWRAMTVEAFGFPAAEKR